MKILNIMLSRGLGGIEQAFIDYAHALTSKNHQVTNITSVFAKVNCTIIDNIKLPNLGPRDFLSVICLRFIIHIIKPNIIIAHGRRAITFAKAAKFSPILGIAHNYNTKYLVQCDYIIALTHHMREHLTRLNVPADKITVIPNMIKIDKPYKARALHTPIRIATCARFVKKKGVDILLRALLQVKQKGYLFEGIIAGEGEEADNLVTLSIELGLQNDIKFLGWITNKQEFFKQIDVFCLPSTHEPFGIILLEAMKYSTPIISTKTEGPLEILEHDKNATLVDIGSIDDLANKIIHMIENPQLAKKYTKTAYLKLQTHYDVIKVAQKLDAYMTTCYGEDFR